MQMSKDQLQHYSELAGRELEVGVFMTYIMKYMMDKGLKLQNTEGMIEASVFPVNYFTLKQVRVRAFNRRCCRHWLRVGGTGWELPCDIAQGAGYVAVWVQIKVSARLCMLLAVSTLVFQRAKLSPRHRSPTLFIWRGPE